MIKFLQFLGLIQNLHKLQKFDEVELKLQRYEKDFFSHLLARFAYLMNPQVDEDEAVDIIRDFIREENLNVHNVHQLGMLVRTTIFDPQRHKDN